MFMPALFILVSTTLWIEFCSAYLKPYNMNNGPVYIVDDDEDDRAFIKEVWQELAYTNELVFFSSGEAVLSRLKTDPVVSFLILCDVNLPGIDGFELKKRLYEDGTL